MLKAVFSLVISSETAGSYIVLLFIFLIAYLFPLMVVWHICQRCSILHFLSLLLGCSVAEDCRPKSVEKLRGATQSYVNRLKRFWKGSSSMRSMWKDVSGHRHDNPVELRIQFDSTKWFINLSSLFDMSEWERAVERLLCVVPETAGNRLQCRPPDWVQEK